MKTLCSLAAVRLPFICCSLLLLNACVPAQGPGGPSTALKQQFAQMQQQQRQQAEQIQVLQQQLERLMQHPLESVTSTDTAQWQPPAAATFNSPESVAMPAAVNQELSALADSASNYLAAFSNLAAGRYKLAESGFDSFLKQYPNHQYTANARYWLASAQLSQDKLQAASANLRQVVNDINGQAKAPAALVLLAKIYRRQHLNNEAEDILEQLRSRYPESTEAQQFYRSDEPKQ